MIKNKKYFAFIIPSILPLVTLSSVSCNNKQEKAKASLTKNDNQSKSWDVFLKYDYVQSILNKAYGNNTELREKYINEQRNISPKYLEDVKSYLAYKNNIVSSFTSDDGYGNGKAYPIDELDSKLDEAYKKNWLWFLFNIDRFVFVLYDVSDQFRAVHDKANIDAQKSSVDLGAFHKPKTNDVAKFVFAKKDAESNEENVYLLLKDGNILQVDLTKDEKDPSKPANVSVFTYTFFYPSVLNNDTEIKNFDLYKYAKAELVHHNDNHSTFKTLFNDEFGGDPLRATLIDVDLSNNKN
ncbi:aromatic motif membrane protein [Mycoplasmopsis bovis]|uniref:aromatic motif membrane protein n=1 Tax=Mycoplasmopsis bovis TaxID=28903 RepID=UPI003D2AD04A